MPPEEPNVPRQTVHVNEKPSLKSRLKLIFWKLTSLVLLIALIVSVVLWKPWQANIKASDRTVTVTGTTTIKAEPDEFVFYPSYRFSNTSGQAALTAMTAKSNEIVAKLKELGVPDSKIKTNAANYKESYSPPPDDTNTTTLSLTVTVGTKELAQKVQDYLLTTSPSGSVTPQSSFSSAKQKQLENQARAKAEEDARSRADQSAKNLGFKVVKVKSVEDGNLNYIGPCGPGSLQCATTQSLGAERDASSSQLTLQPGENELPYSVRVTFYIR